MKSTLSLLLAIIIAFALFTGCSKTPEERAAELFDDGINYLSESKLDKAEASFEEIGSVDPSTPAGLHGVALVMERRFLLFDALQESMIINDSRPSFAPAWKLTWRILTKLELYEDALPVAVEYTNILEYDPEARYVAIRAQFNMGRAAPARAHLDTAISQGLDPAVANLLKAQACLMDHDYEQGEELFVQAFSTNDRSPVFYYEAANYLEVAGQIDSAMHLSRQSAEASGADFELQLAHFDRALNNQYHYEALLTLDRLESEGIADVTLAALRMFYRQSRGELTESRRATASYELLADESISMMYWDLVAHGMIGDDMSVTQDASSILRYVTDNNVLDQFTEFIKYRVAVAVADHGDEHMGWKSLEAIKGIYTNRLDVRLKSMYLYARTGQNDKFAHLDTLLLTFHSSQPEWLIGIADVMATPDVHEYNRAEQLYTMALTIDEYSLPAFTNMTTMFENLKQYDRVLEMFDKFPFFGEQFPELRTKKATALIRTGRMPEGLEEFRLAIPSLKGNLGQFSSLLTILRLSGESQAAEDLVDFLAELCPDNAEALVLASVEKLLAGDASAASKFTQQALAVHPGFMPAQVAQARVLWTTGDKEQAYAQLETLVKANRNNILVNYSLSSMLATDGQDLDRASSLARIALFNAPGDLEIRDNLCYVYLQAGRFDLALGEAHKFQLLFMDHPQPYLRLGMSHFGREEMSEARVNLEKAIDLGLTEPYLSTAREILAKIGK